MLKELIASPDSDKNNIKDGSFELTPQIAQKIGLARALYSDADIYLMDNTLSGFQDSDKGHIFENVIGPQGLLKNKVNNYMTLLTLLVICFIEFY